MPDPDTILLVLGTGKNGTNSFPDIALGGNAPHTTAAQADCQVDTSVADPFGDFDGVMNCDGALDFLKIDDDPDWFYDTAALTIEEFVRLTALPANGTAATFYAQWFNGDNLIWLYYYNNAGSYQLNFDVWSGGVNLARCLIEPYVLNINTWYHIAQERDGNDYDLYVDGVSVANDNNANSLPNLAADVHIAQSPQPWYANARYSNLRVSTVARGGVVPVAQLTPYL